MEPLARLQPAPRKDLSKVAKREKRSRKDTNAAAMDVDMLLAALTDDNATTAQQQQQTQVHYYTYAVPPAPQPPQQPIQQPQQRWEPRLLLRQAYKIATEAFAVVGLESVGPDYGPSVYLVNSGHGGGHTDLTFEDLIGLRSPSIANVVDRYFTEGLDFCAIHLDSVCVEPAGDGNVTVRNFRRPHESPAGTTTVATAPPPSLPLPFTATGWNALNRLFECIESYRMLCAEWSPTVRHLVSRYERYFTERYRPLVGRSRPDIVQHVNVDLPQFLHDLNERRLKVATADFDDYWTLPTSIMTWIDAEIRRFCVPALVDTVLDSLKYQSVKRIV